MSSNNNPEATTAEAPDEASSVAAPVAKDAVSTLVHVNGTEYDIAGLSVEAGLEIYRALSAESQQRALQTAAILTTFASVQKVASDNGLNPTELATAWLAKASETNLAKETVAGLSDAQKKAVSELDALGLNRKNVASMIPGGNAVMGIGTVAGAGLGTAGAAVDGAINGGGRLWNLLATLGTEGWGKVFGYGSGAPSDQALAFGAGLEALHLEETNKRHAMPLIDLPFDGKPSQVWSNPVEYASAGLGWVGEWLAQAMPGIAKFVIGTYRWITYSGKDKPTWQAMVDEAEHDIIKSKQTKPANAQRFAELADEAMWDRESEAVKKSLLAAKTLAGIETETVAEAVTATDVTVRDENGVDRQIVDGKVVSEVTPGQRIAEAGKAVIGDGPWYEQAARGGAAVWVVGQGARGAAESLAAQHLRRPAADIAKAQKTVNALVGFADPDGNEVKGKIALAEERLAKQSGDKTSRAQFWKTSQAEIDAMYKSAADAEDVIKNRGADAARRSANAWDFIKTAATPLKEINDGSKWRTVWNAPRAFFRGVVDMATSIVMGTGSFVWGTGKALYNNTVGLVTGSKDIAVGGVTGVHQVVNHATVADAATKSESIGRTGGRWLTRGLNAFAPVYSAGQTFHDIGVGDTAGAVVHGAQTAAVTGTMVAFKVAKLGVSRSTPIVGALVSGGEFVNAAAHGDSKGMWSAGTDLGLIGGGAAIGAGIGLLGGPFAPVTSTAGAAIGATVGGIAVAGRAVYNMFWGGSEPAAQPVASAPAPRTTPAPQVAAVVKVPQSIESLELTQEELNAIMQSRMAVNRSQADTSKGFDPVAFKLVSSNAAAATRNA